MYGLLDFSGGCDGPCIFCKVGNNLGSARFLRFLLLLTRLLYCKSVTVLGK